MEIVFLGTGAAEGSPAIYCRCAFCNRVRKRGGRDHRTRSSLRIGERHQIDFGPDTAWQLHREHLDMFNVEHILVTHTHSDHFQFEELVSKSQAIVDNTMPLNVYMSDPAASYLESIFYTFAAQIEEEDDLESFKQKYPVRGLAYYQKYTIGELEVETIKGSHLAEGTEQYSCNYLIRLPDGRSLLYAVDTGYFVEESWNFIGSRRSDMLIMDCTFVGVKDGDERTSGHHTMNSFLTTLQRMRSIGFITDRTAIYATHFNPHQNLFHEEIQSHFDKSEFKVIAAYDGLRI